MRRTTLRLLTLAAALAPLAAPAAAQELGHWDFEEGTFFNLHGPASPTVADASPLANHGYRPDPGRRMSYSSDAASGAFSMSFNDPADPRPNPGALVVPTTPSLEPATGWLEMRIKIDHHQSARLAEKATFQFHNREPGGIPVFQLNGQPRIIGRTVYQLGLEPDGRVRAIVANDSLSAPGPWTILHSQHLVELDEWNHLAMEWDGTRLALYVNGQLSAWTSYESTPGHGLSYRATGDDPTYGPVQLDLVLSSGGAAESFVGLMDDVRLASARPCNPHPVRRALVGR